MYRRTLIITTLSIASLVVATSLGAITPGTGSAMAQETESPISSTAEHLGLGDRYETDLWELEIQDVFLTPSEHRAGYSEVRAAVAFRQLSDLTIPYEWAGMTGIAGYPRLQLVDDEGEIWPITITEPAHSLLPGSNLISMEPYVPAHWTIGFEVPSAQTAELTIEALWGDVVVADWDVFTDPTSLNRWSPPPDAISLLVGSPSIDWAGSIRVLVTRHGTTACGPESGSQETKFLLELELSSGETQDAFFPDVRAPDPVAIAIWEDGSSARMTSSGVGTLAGETSLADARNAEQLIVPPGNTVVTIGEFNVARDGRFADVLEPPIAVIFYPPDDVPYWYTVRGSSTIVFPEEACDKVPGGPTFQVAR